MGVSGPARWEDGIERERARERILEALASWASWLGGLAACSWIREHFSALRSHSGAGSCAFACSERRASLYSAGPQNEAPREAETPANVRREFTHDDQEKID